MRDSSVFWLYRWYVRKVDPDPMYGHDRIIKRFDNKEEAIRHASMLTARGRDGLFVEERRYANERNLERDFCFDSHIVWAAWLDNGKEG